MIKSFRGRYYFLSNFYLYPIQWEGLWYPTSEHAYQATKTTDRLLRRRLSTTVMGPGEAKSAGQQLRLREDWERIKLGVMLSILRIKFSGPLGLELAETYPHKLVEGNTWGDTYWGVCRGKGENYLGKLLMQVRWEVRMSKKLS